MSKREFWLREIAKYADIGAGTISLKRSNDNGREILKCLTILFRNVTDCVVVGHGQESLEAKFDAHSGDFCTQAFFTDDTLSWATRRRTTVQPRDLETGSSPWNSDSFTIQTESVFVRSWDDVAGIDQSERYEMNSHIFDSD